MKILKKNNKTNMSGYKRIAVVDVDRCKPSKCKQECAKHCPVNSIGKLCIEVTKIAIISEDLCTGCNICTKKCPFKAIKIINLPKSNNLDVSHRYNMNSFQLHRLPMPKTGQILGLIGSNGIGKSTALKILSGKLVPNFGNFNQNTSHNDIITYYRGSELQTYFTKLYNNQLTCITKSQYIDSIPKIVHGTVDSILTEANQFDQNYKTQILEDLDLTHLLNRQVDVLSGGELQRFAIAICSVKNVDTYMIDEPSSYLDVDQRLKMSKLIRKLCDDNKYIIVVEHDLSILDYISDTICCLYGEPGGYGVVTMPYSVREGINIYVDGFIPTENLRFRNESLTFNLNSDLDDKLIHRYCEYIYEQTTKTLGNFKLIINEGKFSNSEIIVLLGQNGTGKSTYLKMIAGLIKSDNDQFIPELQISYKPQLISPKYEGTVKQLLVLKISNFINDPQFMTDIIRPLKIEELYDYSVQNLSGGELQRIAIVLALGKPADVYLLDEPSAYLDVEQRLIVARGIKRFIHHTRKTAFVVEHDMIMATYLADKVIVYTGIPGHECIAHSPQSLISGMNMFLKNLDITFRRDPTNFRFRVNKLNSLKDKTQKQLGQYFVCD